MSRNIIIAIRTIIFRININQSSISDAKNQEDVAMGSYSTRSSANHPTISHTSEHNLPLILTNITFKCLFLRAQAGLVAPDGSK